MSVTSPASVLIVDDDPSSLMIVDMMLSAHGRTVRRAESAAQAMAVLQGDGSDAYEAVVTDYWMPGGTGVDLMRQAQGLDPTLAFVLITAEGEKNIIAEALRSGSCDYLDKPVQAARLLDAVGRAAHRTKEQRELRATAAEALALGRAQAQLIARHSRSLHDRLALFYHSHTEASGDFISVFPVSAGRVTVLASDTSGHDLSAAFQANYFHGLARGMSARGAGIRDIFAAYNQQLLEEWNAENTVITSLAAIGLLLDFETRHLSLINCGAPLPLVVGREGWGEYLPSIEPAGPLGWFPEIPSEARLPLPAGALLLWSDGLNDHAEQLDVDPIALSHRLLGARSGTEAIVRGSRDDILALRISTGVSARPDYCPVLSADYRGSQCGEIDRLTQWWDRSLRLALPELSDERLADIVVCTREATLNGLIHGCRRAPDAFTRVRAAVTPDHATLRLRVSDDGPGHDFDAAGHEEAASAQMLTEHRGLVMIRHIPDTVEFARQGAELTMTFQLTPTAA